MQFSSLAGLLAALLCCSPVFTQAQSAPARDNTLLWRISGHGLTKPSYLFGTMHLTDKRLFRFDDSVYNAIEQTEGLAIEINPDEMVAYFINQMFDKISDHKSVRDMLSDEDYEQYHVALERKFGKSADKITTRDLVREKNKWVNDYLKKGEMPTFVDAYLFNIARRQGKWVGGIEDLTDQTGLINDIIDKTDIKVMTADEGQDQAMTIEKMISLYTAQDLKGIDRYMNTSSGLDKSDFLYHRNAKMARRMDSLSAMRTMFFAVGAAHLPGDSGVISLLRRRGFTVSPVFSDHKTEANDYHFKEVPIRWVHVKDQGGLYTVKMPGQPVPVKMEGLIDANFFFDIFSMTGYYVMTVLNPSGIDDPEKTYDVMASSLIKGDLHPKYKRVEASGIQGREYSGLIKNTYARVRMYVADNVVYLVMVNAYKKGVLTSDDGTRFFDSFNIKDKQAIASGTIPKLYVDSIMAISFNTGAVLAESKALTKDTKETWRMHTLAGMDPASKAYILLMQKELQPGFQSTGDSTALAVYYNSSAFDGKTENVFIEGYRGLKMTGKRDGAGVRLITYIRGNKNITLAAIGDSLSLQRPAINNMFASVKLLPYQAISFKGTDYPEGGFTTAIPDNWAHYKNGIVTKDSKGTLLSFDKATSISYTIITDTLSKYEWHEQDTAFWGPMKRGYCRPGKDDLVYEKTVQNDGASGREYLVRRYHSAVYARTRILRYGNIIYTLHASCDTIALSSNNANRFFTEFRLLYKPVPFDLKASKAGMIVADLSSRDSATRVRALHALINAKFQKANLPLLHNALFKPYRSSLSSDTTLYINERIADKIAELGDPSSLTFIRTQYPGLVGKNADKRTVALLLLSGIKKKESYQLLSSLIITPPYVKGENYSLQSKLQDSMTLLAKVYPVHVACIAGYDRHGRIGCTFGLPSCGQRQYSIVCASRPRAKAH